MINKFRSGLEEAVQLKLNKQFKYEPYKIPYIISKNYLPDFVHEKKRILVEVKGFFRVGDTKKYTSIRDSCPDWELVFIFSNPNKKVRKGSKICMGKWCDKERFKYYTIDTVDMLVKYIGEKNVSGR
tara:strand:- start:18326 stop:18706 length:381 start_codon:yes stop_codon:yes gene_type:complete